MTQADVKDTPLFEEQSGGRGNDEPKTPCKPPVSEAEIAETLRLDAAATAGPWRHPLVQDGEVLPGGSGYAGEWEEDRRAVVLPAGPESDELSVADCERMEDAALITAYRTAAPALAREVRRLMDELRTLAAALHVAEQERNRARNEAREARNAVERTEELVLAARRERDEALAQLRPQPTPAHHGVRS